MAPLDRAVADEFDLQALLYGIPRKRGRPPELGNRGNFYGRQGTDGPEIFFNLDPEPVQTFTGRRLAAYRGKPRDIRPTITKSGATGHVAFDVPFGQGKRFVPGILKVAFNCFTYLMGPAEARGTGYQSVRDYVLKGIGHRHVIFSAATDNRFTLIAYPPWKSSDGLYIIEMRIGSIQFLVDLSENESIYPILKAKAQALYGEEGWTTLPT